MRVAGSTSLHQASCVTMSLAVDCLTIVFDWCTTLLINVKKQLTSIKKSNTKHFGYGTILCTLFFERIWGLRPKVLSTISGLRDPHIGRWDDLMKRIGGGEVPKTNFDDDFFLWWEQQVISIEDYLYAGMDFRGDPDLVLPPDAAWGAINKNIFKFFKLFYFFVFQKLWIEIIFDEKKVLTKLFDHDTTVWPIRPEGLPSHRHHGRDMESVAAKTERLLHTVQRNLDRLNHQVPMVAIEDLLEAMQRRVVGVPWDWVRLF